MARYFKRSSKFALPPGTLPEASVLGTTPAVVTVIDYTEGTVQEGKVKDIAECFPYRDKNSVTWINIDGIDLDVIKKLDAHYGIHSLVTEDIATPDQRPKVEDYGDYQFLVFRMIYIEKDTEEIHAEQISLLLGSNYVISFQETVGDVFDPIRERIRHAGGRVRKMGADYLAYCLLDMVIDNYFVVLEKIGEELEVLEGMLIDDNQRDIIYEIHQRRADMVFLRRQIWPLRDMISTMQRSESKLIKKTTAVYLRDLYDHIIRVIEAVESFRDILSSLHDLYLSNITNRTNEVMKVLTIFAAIFIPLTFLAGVYGMNFDFMPGLHWRWGYHVLLAFMLIIAVGMVFFFKKRRWL